MRVQIVTFSLKEISDADYQSVCDQFADVVARMPGLVSKVWLADEAANTYGGVYTWVDRAAMEAYLRSDFFAGIVANPNLPMSPRRISTSSRDRARSPAHRSRSRHD